MVYSFLESKEAQFIKEYGNSTPVVIAKVDIKELELIDDRKVKVRNIPESFIAPGAFTNVQDVFSTLATVPILKNEQITKPRVTYPGARTGLASQVSIGKRALSVRVNESQSVSKLIKPGDRVDVLTLIDYAGGRKDKLKIKTVLQNVYVLSTGLSVTNNIPLVGLKTDNEVKTMKLNNYTNFNSVTLELTPFEVQKMIYLIRAGSGIYLSLRNNDDKKTEVISGTRIFDVLGEDAADAKSFFLERNSQKKRRR
jgi:pilus assembly protein CpaB